MIRLNQQFGEYLENIDLTHLELERMTGFELLGIFMTNIDLMQREGSRVYKDNVNEKHDIKWKRKRN